MFVTFFPSWLGNFKVLFIIFTLRKGIDIQSGNLVQIYQIIYSLWGEGCIRCVVNASYYLESENYRFIIVAYYIFKSYAPSFMIIPMQVVGQSYSIFKLFNVLIYECNNNNIMYLFINQLLAYTHLKERTMSFSYL